MLASTLSVRRQTKHISDLIAFDRAHFGVCRQTTWPDRYGYSSRPPIQRSERGPAVPLAAWAAATTRADTLGIKWGCAEHRAKVPTSDLSSREVTQVPPFSTEFLVALEHIAGNSNAEIGLQIFASAILLTVHASLGFIDIHQVAKFDVSQTVVRGASTSRKVQKKRGLPRPSASIPGGSSGKSNWLKPIMAFIQSYCQSRMVSQIHCTGDKW